MAEPDVHELILSVDSDGWEVGCSCGWDSPRTFDEDDQAEDAWENHCDVVFMEATGG